MMYKQIDKQTIVIDGRGKPKEDIQNLAIKVLLNGKATIEDHHKNGDHGTFLACNLINYYNVKSICDGIVVASTNILVPEQTRPIAANFLKEAHNEEVTRRIKRN